MATTVELFNDDCRTAMALMIARGVKVHSVVTDAPYGLVSITKRFGKADSQPAKFGKDGAFARVGAGFMGSKWDGTGIENDPEMWRLCYELLLPGGYLIAFSSPRTGHRMACAIEDAGFIIHPFIGWANGQGMPKPHAADKAIDRELGLKGEIIPVGNPVKRMIPGADQNKQGWEKNNGREYQPGTYVPASPQAGEWLGWAYGGQARKPVLEPIYVAQKPFSEKNGALNLMKHGVGAVNIAGCRASGRHPGNLIHDGSPEVIAQFPAEAGARAPVKGTESSASTDVIYGKFNRVAGIFHDDSGSAARFFECYQFLCPNCQDQGWIATAGTWDNPYGEQERCPVCEGRSALPFVFENQTVFYHPKAASKDRAGSKHPTVKPIGLMRALVRHVTPKGGTVLDPFAGTGTTGQAAREEGMSCILIEAEDQFAADIRRRLGLSNPAADMFDDLLGDAPINEFEDLLG